MPRIGIALGSGAARGWAHIGVLQELAKMQIEPDVICGSSIGALVGGSSVAGQLEQLEEWLLTLDRLQVAKFFDVSLIKGGLIAGKRIIDFFRERFGDFEISALAKPYGAVATDLYTGQEIWFRSGYLLDAVRASISIPGLFAPFFLNGRWYIDGGIVNPVPVSLCRALGADTVIAVDVNGCIADDGWSCAADTALQSSGNQENVLQKDTLLAVAEADADGPAEAEIGAWQEATKTPGFFQVIYNSLHFMQQTITRARLAYDPPDVALCPDIYDIGFMDFHEAEKAIADGRRCVQEQESQIVLLENL